MKRVLLLITLAHLGSLSPFFDLAANDIHGSRVRNNQDLQYLINLCVFFKFSLSHPLLCWETFSKSKKESSVVC